MNARKASRCGSWLVLLFWLPGPQPAYTNGLSLEDGRLHAAGQPLRIRGVNYAPRKAAQRVLLPGIDCQLARDLPLIAAAGANTVRTNGIPAENEPVLRSVLETTGLYWLAGFSLEPYYDPETSIQAKKEEILGDLRRFAERQLENERLVAIVIGEEVSQGYEQKFAGRPEEFYRWLSEAGGMLSRMRPENPLLVATVVRDPGEMETVAPGLSFWIWKVEGWSGAAERVREAVRNASAPVLIEGFLAAAEPEPESEGGDGAERNPAAEAGAAVRELEEAGLGLGFIWVRYSEAEAEGEGPALFRSGGGEAGWESMSATPYYETLAGVWGDRRHGEWWMEEPARPEAVVHAASGAAVVAPGSLARIRGAGLAAAVYSANGVPWPLHQGETCVCADGRPLPMGMISPEAGTVLIPWEMGRGEHEAVYYRAGKSGGAVRMRVEAVAPGLFEDAIRRENERCGVGADNGVRPGERVRLYGTGFGAGAPLEIPPRVWVNGREAEVLYAGLELTVPGLTRIDIRVNPTTPPSEQGSLVVRSGEFSAPAVRVRVEASASRYGIQARTTGKEVVVQAGGPAVGLAVAVEGSRGYCGPVEVEARGLPPGVRAEAASGWTGGVVELAVQAAADAPAQKGAPFVLYAGGGDAEPSEQEARITVLPSRGLIPVSAYSNGYRTGYPRAQFRWNGQLIFDTAGGGPGRGINVLTADPNTGVFSAVRSFDTWGDESASVELTAYLESLPEGTLALFAVADEGSRLLSPSARSAISKMFFSRYIWLLDYQDSWTLIGRKGRWAFVENWSAQRGVAAFTNVSFPMP